MNISVVVPSYNESESLPELCTWIEKVMISNSFTYEIIIADDGSTDDSWDVIKKLSKQKFQDLRKLTHDFERKYYLSWR